MVVKKKFAMALKENLHNH